MLAQALQLTSDTASISHACDDAFNPPRPAITFLPPPPPPQVRFEPRRRSGHPLPARAGAMIGTLCTWLVALIFGAYAIPHLIVAWFYKTKNLKKAYGAEWALVTGASSGARVEGCGAGLAAPCSCQLCAAPQLARPPACLPAPPRAHTHAHTLVTVAQASASRLRASWRARA